MRAVLVPVAVLSMLLARTSVVRAQGVHESTVTAAPDALVSIRAVDGNVRVVGSARHDVKVSSTSDDVRVTSDGGHVSIVVRPGSSPSIEVAVPSTVRVDVHGTGVSASVRDVAGPVHVGNVNGDIAIEGTARDVEAASVSGRVQVSLQHADVRATSVSGEVSIRLATGGTAWAKTVSGPVHVSGAPLTRLEVRTVSGNVDLDTRLEGSGPFEANSHSGGVRVVLPKGAPVSVEVRTYNGNVDNPDAGSPSAAGRAVLTVSTFSGDVHVERR
jgi:DUF4097 and DUF4098 domain-containing protein YvlB